MPTFFIRDVELSGVLTALSFMQLFIFPPGVTEGSGSVIMTVPDNVEEVVSSNPTQPAACQEITTGFILYQLSFILF